MPSGVQAGESLSIEHHGVQYSIPAPGDVAPGAVFTVTLPDDDDQPANSGSGYGNGNGYGNTAPPISASSVSGASGGGAAPWAESVQEAVPVGGGYAGGGYAAASSAAAAPAMATVTPADSNTKAGSANPF